LEKLKLSPDQEAVKKNPAPKSLGSATLRNSKLQDFYFVSLPERTTTQQPLPLHSKEEKGLSGNTVFPMI